MAATRAAGIAFHSHASGENMKNTALWALPIAATLAITGCSAATTPDAATEPGQSATATEPSQAATAEATPGLSASPAGPGSSAPGTSTTPQATASAEGTPTPGKQLTANQLVTVAKALQKEYGKDGAKIIKNSDLQASAQTIEEVVAGMKVSPAKCGAFAVAGMSEMLERVTMVALVLPADANDLSTSVSIASYDTAGVLDQLQAKARESKGDCSKFTLTMQGVEASAQVKEVKAKTTAKTTMATETQVKVMGRSVTTLTVAGYDQRSNVSVSISQPQDLDKAVTEAEKYIDLALRHMAAN